VEVLVLYAKKLNEVKDIKVALPRELFNLYGVNNQYKNIYEKAIINAAKRKLTLRKQPNQIREALVKGYVEMAQINLAICSEYLYVEYEAEHTLERLVSGG
jgi:CopG family transcriptional regulator/antitoxin EndoAI